MAAGQHPNRLLASLPAADFEFLRPHLKPFELVHEDLLFDAGHAVNWAYFPHSGVISLVVDLADGQRIEAAMVGRDSVVGASAALVDKVALNTGIVQVAGAASILDVPTLQAATERSADFRAMFFIRHQQILLAQAQQSAACNASHSVEPAAPFVPADAGSQCLRQSWVCPGVPGADARRAADQRLARRQHLAKRRSHPATAAAGSRSPIWRGCRPRPASATPGSRCTTTGCWTLEIPRPPRTERRSSMIRFQIKQMD